MTDVRGIPVSALKNSIEERESQAMVQYGHNKGALWRALIMSIMIMSIMRHARAGGDIRLGAP